MRKASLKRTTRETSITLKLTIEGRGRYDVRTGIRFFDHMLELFARHGAFDLVLRANGDLDVDQHHTVEDVGIALGEAVASALGTRRGIHRAGYFVMPMDETLAVAAIDLSGRPHAVVDLKRAHHFGGFIGLFGDAAAIKVGGDPNKPDFRVSNLALAGGLTLDRLQDRRTLLTSLSVWLVVIVLYAIGGEGVHLFAFVMVVGVIVGTYSSIYIASPLLLIFGEGAPKQAPARERLPQPTETPA